MKPLLQRVLIPILSLFLGTIGNSFFSTLLSMDLRDLGFSNVVIGGIVSMYYAGMLIGSWLLEKKIAKIGFTISYLILIFLNILLVAAFLLSNSIYFWYFIRFGLGFVLGGIFIIVESWILLLSPPEKKGEALSLYMIGLYLGASLGQLLLKDSTRLFPISTLIPIGCCIAATVIMLFRPNDYQQDARQLHPELTTKEVLLKAPLGFYGNLLSGLTLSVFYGLVPLYGQALGLSTDQVGMLMSLTIAGGFVGQWPAGKISDLFSKDRILILNVLATAIFCLPMLFGTAIPFPILCANMFIFGVLIFTLYPLSINSLCEKLPQDQTVSAVTKGVIAYGIGCVLGPLLAPFFMHTNFKEGLFGYFFMTTFLFVTTFMIKKFRTQPSSD